MPNETFTESRASNAWYVAGAAAFAAMGIWLGTLGEIIGWICVAFFGSLLVGSIQDLIWPNQLELSDAGFTSIERGGRKRVFTSWHDVGEFRATRIRSRGIGVVTRIVYSTNEAKTGARITRSVFGYEKMLATYGQEPSSLVESLNARRRAAASAPRD